MSYPCPSTPLHPWEKLTPRVPRGTSDPTPPPRRPQPHRPRRAPSRRAPSVGTRTLARPARVLRPCRYIRYITERVGFKVDVCRVSELELSLCAADSVEEWVWAGLGWVGLSPRVSSKTSNLSTLWRGKRASNAYTRCVRFQ